MLESKKKKNLFNAKNKLTKHKCRQKLRQKKLPQHIYSNTNKLVASTAGEIQLGKFNATDCNVHSTGLRCVKSGKSVARQNNIATKLQYMITPRYKRQNYKKDNQQKT